uniref:glycosyltransferase family 2 protein n=1 Tax=Flavobacterium sp. TaxID=239 RepID=UPI004048B6A8
MFNPLVSIIIPTYNRANLISETLKSVLDQTYTNWECIVVDDGSTDDTASIVADYVKSDARFQYHKRPETKIKGANACRNFGFEISKGEYVKWLDSDDLISDDLLDSQIKTISFTSEFKNVVVTSKWNYFKDTLINVKPKEKEINKNYDSGFDLINDFGEYNLFVPPHIYLVDRFLITKCGLWNESLLINQDGEFFVRVLLCVNKILHADKGMVYYRYGFSNDNTSSFSSEEKCRHSILSWILIDSYIKIHTNRYTSIKYVNNAKKILLDNIFYKDLLKDYQWFLGKKR